MKKGIDLYNILTPHVGEVYLLGALVPKDNPNWRGPWDCAETIAWGIYQLTGKLYGCANNNGKPSTADAYTGFLDRDARKMGIIITVDQANRTPGAILLRVAADGQVGHAVVCDGKGGTIEAHSRKTGFIKSVVTGRRWSYGILVPWIEYEESAAPFKTVPPVSTIYRFKTPIMEGPVVVAIQTKLKALRFYKMAVDGKFGRGTFEAVRAYQDTNELNPDGEVGPKTAALLNIQI